MKGFYYKLPLNFDDLTKKNDVSKIPLEISIGQNLFLLATTAFGECKFDETFGTEIWEMDFDLTKSDNHLRELIISALKKAINRHEKRLELEDLEVFISDYNLGTCEKKRIKKKVNISIKGVVLETNRPFAFSNSFFIGPLSY
nr:GPW/gp25 family protein [uncultured Chryseobacterium sp.]